MWQRIRKLVLLWLLGSIFLTRKTNTLSEYYYNSYAINYFSDYTTIATTEQMKRWIMQNKHLLPREIRDSITNASGAEIAAAVLRMLGFKPTHTKAPLESIIPAELTVDNLPSMLGNSNRIANVIRPVRPNQILDKIDKNRGSK